MAPKKVATTLQTAATVICLLFDCYTKSYFFSEWLLNILYKVYFRLTIQELADM